MDKRQKILLFAGQVAIVAAFVILAAGSSKESSKSVLRGAGQGLSCSAQGYTFVGYVSSASECSDLCESKGYSRYCTGDSTASCYCK